MLKRVDRWSARLLRATAGGVALALLAVEPCLAASGEFADKAAHVLALFIIIVVPIGGIALFWLVHVLPEKIAEKRHHPQKDAIQVLCLLSLVFGGLLWPLAWLWAYSKPVLHKMAYGRDKHDDYYARARARGRRCRRRGSPLREELGRLRQELEIWSGAVSCPTRCAVSASGSTRLERRAAPHRGGRGRRADGSPDPRDLQLLRLADLHQVQVAAVEYDVAGHGRRHSDRRR